MQCVILAAGKGVRLAPLTLTRPKPLISVGGKPILAHVIGALPESVTELVIVINYLGEHIVEYFGREYEGKKITYITHASLNGTGGALESAREVLRGKFLVIPADDLHGGEALERALEHPLAILAAPSEHPERFGVIERSPQGLLESIDEKPAEPKSNLVNTGAMVLDERVFDYEVPLQPNGDLYLTDMVCALARSADMVVIEQPFWLPIGYPEDLERAESILARGHASIPL